MSQPDLEALWDSLCRVKRLWFVARSEQATGLQGVGSGTVEVTTVAPGVITFTEKGTRQTLQGKQIQFFNVFRWSRVEPAKHLRLEHLRYGIDNPVHLFDLMPAGDGSWQPANPHLCREDCYRARLHIKDRAIHLNWEISGPRKQEQMEYIYTREEEAVSGA
jgi:hypothetical protein